MSILMLSCLLFLSLPETSVLDDSMDVLQPWTISWPIFSLGELQHSVMHGYGDWCGETGVGPHPGIDLIPDSVYSPEALPLDSVLSPAGGIRYNREIGNSLTGWRMGVALDEGSNGWWDLGHLSIVNPDVSPFREGDEISPRQVLAPVIQAPVPDWVPHLHLAWDITNSPDLVPGYWNPFECFEDGDLDGYDSVVFNPVEYEWDYPELTGAWFMPDKCEAPCDFASAPGHPDPGLFQDVICGDVDIAVSPNSQFRYPTVHPNAPRDSSGVYSVSYHISWENPYNCDWDPTNGEGSWSERVLMQMKGVLPYGISSEFRAIFLDGLYVGGGGVDWPYFSNAYIVTNCGARDTSAWETGWSNVWTKTGDESCISDWYNDVICQGAWHTNLAIRDLEVPSDTRDAQRNDEAFFPDGRYAVDVTAVSHGSRDIGEMRLPVDNILDPTPTVQGIVVDNWPPHIVEACLYAESEERNGAEVEYSAAWVTGLDPAIAEEIRTLEQQLEEMRNPGSYMPLPEFSMPLDPVSSIGLLSADPLYLELPSAADEHRVVGQSNPVVSQYCIDPVTFIQSRLDSLRGLDVEVLRYLIEGVTNYPDLTQDFGIVVRFSEPMIEEDPAGREVIDQIWLEGTQGDDVVWDSRDSGYLEAQEPMFWPDADGLPPGPNWSAGRLEQAQGFWRVYEYVGAPAPEGFNGMLTLCVGYDENSDALAGPRDLAGNALDGNPETISATREGYGPWIGPDGPVPRYEPRVDAHYSWGKLHWISFMSPGSRYFDGYCEEDLIESIDLVEVGVGPCEDFFGDCGYNCGFWVFQDEQGVRGFEIQTIHPYESFDNYLFSTQYPVGDSSLELPQWMICGGWDSCSDDGRYCWMTGLDLEDFPSRRSTGYIYCVDVVTGAVLSRSLCNGFWWGEYGGQFDWRLSASFIQILDVYSTGHAFVRCWSCPVVGGAPVIEYQLIAPPVPEPPSSEDDQEGDASTSTDLVDPEIELRSNPVDSFIEILIPDGSGTTVTASLFDITGRIVMERDFAISEGDGELTMDVRSVPSGVYHLRIEGDSFSEMMSVTVIH